MSGDRRVAVTGLGVVAPAGIGVDAFWSGLLGPGISDGRQSIEIEDWDPTPVLREPEARPTGRPRRTVRPRRGR